MTSPALSQPSFGPRPDGLSSFFRYHGVWAPGVRLFRRVGFGTKALFVSLGFLAPLALLQSRHGSFFVTGNHEYYSGAHAWIAELNKLDDELLAETENDDEEGFRRTLGALLDAVRRLGTPLADDELEPSDLILPAPDASLAEVRLMLNEDGLIPD